MDAYISSNCPELSDLLARVQISDRERSEITTPISSPRLVYDRLNRRTPPCSNDPSRPRSQDSAADDTSDYYDSSFERTIANIPEEDLAALNDRQIVEISTDDDSDGNEDSPPSRSSSPTMLAMDFSRDPVTLARRVVLSKSYDPVGKNGRPILAAPKYALNPD
ncbi:hypothetical protein HWV62_19133 [Athelia sp. TMB]|nr:hypothetical protein HWV62_19133 [Athelia sp. TMB]